MEFQSFPRAGEPPFNINSSRVKSRHLRIFTQSCLKSDIDVLDHISWFFSERSFSDGVATRRPGPHLIRTQKTPCIQNIAEEAWGC